MTLIKCGSETSMSPTKAIEFILLTDLLSIETY